jgi:hypothetical protein
MRINEFSVYQLAINIGTFAEMIKKLYSHARSIGPSFAQSMTKSDQNRWVLPRGAP